MNCNLLHQHICYLPQQLQHVASRKADTCQPRPCWHSGSSRKNTVRADKSTTRRTCCSPTSTYHPLPRILRFAGLCSRAAGVSLGILPLRSGHRMSRVRAVLAAAVAGCTLAVVLGLAPKSREGRGNAEGIILGIAWNSGGIGNHRKTGKCECRAGESSKINERI